MAPQDKSQPKGKPLGSDAANGATGSGKALGDSVERSSGRGKALDPGYFDNPPPRRTTSSVPVQKAAAPPAAPPPAASGAHPNPMAPPPITIPGAPPAPGTTAPRELTTHQKQTLKSAFEDRERQRKLNSMLGTNPETQKKLFDDDDDDEPTALGARFDGDTPSPQLTGRDVWKAVQAPLQSREGRRSVELYQAVIAQFAVGANPRYEPDGPGKPRAHIFVWDVSRAMNCEIPHFVGARELTLAQTVDWLRHEGPMRGWLRAPVDEAHAAALAGQMVVVMPKDIKLKHMAVVLPEDTDPNGKPYVAAASLKRGKRLALNEAIGVFLAEYFVHP